MLKTSITIMKNNNIIPIKKLFLLCDVGLNSIYTV